MRQHRLSSLFLVMFFVLSACGGGSSAPPPIDNSELLADTPYTLAANDRIRVQVFGHEDLSGEFELDGSGNFPMPLVGEIDGFGLTPLQLQKRISDTYVEQGFLRKAEVTVEVLNFRPFSILGEVRNPGQYEYSSGMTVLTAVAIAGGFTYRANQNAYVLQRNANEVSVDGTTRIQPGDIVTVTERWF